jgi:hypothetical protein
MTVTLQGPPIRPVPYQHQFRAAVLTEDLLKIFQKGIDILLRGQPSHKDYYLIPPGYPETLPEGRRAKARLFRPVIKRRKINAVGDHPYSPVEFYIGQIISVFLGRNNDASLIAEYIPHIGMSLFVQKELHSGKIVKVIGIIGVQGMNGRNVKFLACPPGSQIKAEFGMGMNNVQVKGPDLIKDLFSNKHSYPVLGFFGKLN